MMKVHLLDGPLAGKCLDHSRFRVDAERPFLDFRMHAGGRAIVHRYQEAGISSERAMQAKFIETLRRDGNGVPIERPREISVGTTVTLNSGGPELTVTAVNSESVNLVAVNDCGQPCILNRVPLASVRVVATID